jgi:hypothetical protein
MQVVFDCGKNCGKKLIAWKWQFVIKIKETYHRKRGLKDSTPPTP